MQLNSLQLSSLLQEVAAMVEARRPIASGFSELGHASMGTIGVAAQQLSRQLESGKSPADAISSVSGRFAPMTRAAVQCVQRTGSSEPVYHLAAALRRRHERQTRAAVARIYPAITLTVAYLVASVGLSTLIIEMSNSDLVLLDAPPRLIDASYWLQQYFWVPLIALGCLVACVWMIARTQPAVAVKLLPWNGQTEQLTFWASFCDMLAIAIESGFPFDDAIEMAAEISGQGGRQQEGWQTRMRSKVDEIRGGATHLSDQNRLTDVDSPIPPLLKWRLNSLVWESRTAPDADEIRNLANWYHLRSQQRWQFWSEWFPLLSTIGIMTALVLALSLLIVKPIYDLS